MGTERLSEEGKAEVERARKQKGYAYDSARWCTDARVSEKTLARFRSGQGIKKENFISLCQAVGLDWKKVADVTIEQSDELTVDDDLKTSGENPFQFGQPIAPSGFYGRSSELRHLRGRIGAPNANPVNIIGYRRSGKSSLLRYLCECPNQIFSPNIRPAIVPLDLQNRCFHSPEGVWEGVRRGINQATNQEFWARDETGDPFAVEDGLMALRDQGWRLVVMIDELEALGERLEMFQNWGDDWRAKGTANLLVTVISTSRPLSDVYKSLNLTSPFGNTFSALTLGPLAENEWKQLVSDKLLNLTTEAWSWLDAATGGWPFYVQMAGLALWEKGNLPDAQIEFKFQAQSTMKHLWEKLRDAEKTAIGLAVEGRSSGIEPAILTDLQRLGLLRNNGKVFSKVFEEIVSSFNRRSS